MPTLPPVDPERSASGIVVDPNTLERIVPSTKRADGTMRKELRIRPGFTPQEDVGMFRSRRQQAAEGRGALPAGHIPGWGGPRGTPAATGAAPAKRAVPGAAAAAAGEAKSKAAKKNEKRKEKKKEAKEKEPEPVRDAWDEEDEAEGGKKENGAKEVKAEKAEKEDQEVDRLAEELEKATV